MAMMEDLNKLMRDDQRDVNEAGKSLRLIIGIITVIVVLVGGGIGLATGFYGAGKWTGEINSKLSLILTRVDLISNTADKTSARLDEYEKRLNKIELQGSPQLNDLKREVEEIRESLRIHLAIEPKGPK